jgi:hypothetical protein
MKNPQLFKNGKAFIKSMEVLIERYRAAIKAGISKLAYEADKDLDCLLCYPIGVPRKWESCQEKGCPWIVILGICCDDFEIDDWDSSVYQTDNPIIMRRRIRQLQNWIKIYKKHMGIL